MQRKYTQEQLDYVKRWYGHAHSRTIAKRIGATDAAIRSLAAKLGIPVTPDDCMGIYELSSIIGISHGGCSSLLEKIYETVKSYGRVIRPVFTLKGDVNPFGQEAVFKLSQQDNAAIAHGFRPLSSIRKKAGISSAVLTRYLNGELKGSKGTQAELFSEYFIRENIVGKRYAILRSELLNLDASALQELGYDVSKATKEEEVYQTLEARIEEIVRLELPHRKKIVPTQSGFEAGITQT